jgi:hypothetical protein
METFASLTATVYQEYVLLVRPESINIDKARETERGGPCRPIETEVNRDSGSTYDRVSFLGYLPKTGLEVSLAHCTLV